jgi:hypothetical protein
MTAALSALIRAVDAGTATGGPDAEFANVCRLIEAVMGEDDDERIDDVVEAHDGDLNAAVEVVRHLHGADAQWMVTASGEGQPAAVVAYKRGATAPTPARALLLAALRAKLAETAPSGQKGDEG